MTRTKRHVTLIMALLTLVGLALGACNFPGPQPAQDVFATAAAQTVAAQLTLQALTSPPVPTPVPPTSTPVPTPAPSATPAPPTATPGCSDKAQFVSDITISDGTNLAPGAGFVKTWRLKNAGTCTWTTAYALVFVSGNIMNGPTSQPLLGSVAPGSNVDISVNLKAPTSNGSYKANWELRNATGALFGIGAGADQAFWVLIVVGPTPTPEASIYKTAHLSIQQTYLADLDGGVVLSGPDYSAADLWFQAVSDAEKYISPKNGAKMLKMAGIPELADCSGAALSSANIPLGSLPVGSWVCYKTNQGRYGRFQVDTLTAGPSQTITIDLRTWGS